MHVRTLILGGGPTGLGAAWRLHELGKTDWLLLESAATPGGLASSFLDAQGFTWDIGGHIQFSHYAYFDRVMLELLGAEGWVQHPRESWIWLRDRFVPYPFQNNLHRLPEREREMCLEGLVALRGDPPPTPLNFREWIYSTMGRGIADVFLVPYNEKVWAYPPEMLGTGWLGERVPVPDLERIRRNILTGADDLGWGPNSTFQFPRKGGTGAVWQACASRLPQEKIFLESRAEKIDFEKKQVETSDGRSFTYEHLITTMPLTELLKVSGQTQFAGVAQEGLLSSTTHVIGLGLEGRPKPDLATKGWIYFPEDDCPFYRATIFSNYSPANVPGANYWSLMFEISESSQKLVNVATLLADTIAGARATRLIDEDTAIVSTWSHRAAFGYPTPSLKRDAALGEILSFLERHQVYSRGRFGLWKYEVSNQDHCFMQGVEIIGRLYQDTPEMTAVDSARTNSGKHAWPAGR